MASSFSSDSPLSSHSMHMLSLPVRMGFSLGWWGPMTGGAPCSGLKKVAAFSHHQLPWKMSFPLHCRTTQPTWVSHRELRGPGGVGETR